MRKRVWLKPLLAMLLMAVLALAGCSGNDGAQGPQGIQGPEGPQGPAGPGVSTAESCEVCHTTGTLVDIANFHPVPTNDDLVLSNIVVSNNGGFPMVTFHAADLNGTAVTNLANGAATFRLADLVAAGTGDNTFSTDYWEMWDAEKPGTAAQLVDCAPATAYDSGTGTCVASTNSHDASGSLAHLATNDLDMTNAATGDYSYTFVYAFGSAWPGYNNAGYAAANTKRLVIELSSPPAGFKKAIGVEDFSGDPGAGNTATSVASPRQFVTIEACRKCHGPEMDGAAHANNRNDIRACDMCHSALYGSLPRHAAGFMATDNADLPVFIHGIHGSTWTDLDDIAGNDTSFEEGPEVTYPVTYPQGLVEGNLGVKGLANCTVCHSDPSGTAPGDLTELDNWKTHPTRRVCQSCHTAIDFVNGATFVGLDGVSKSHPQELNDTGCTFCHAASGGPLAPSSGLPPSMEVAHDPTKATDYDSTTDIDAPEYDVTISAVDADGVAVDDAGSVYTTNGGYFVAGDSATISVTLKNHADGTDVAGALYTTAQDDAYVAGGGLHVASLYVYGPRSDVKPLLTDGGAYKQGINMFAGTTAIDDASVTTDTDGFHVVLTIPAGATPGTYMIRARIGDYDYNRSSAAPAGQDAYKIESYALVTFQIGTATEQKKVDGDTCVDCHGATKFHVNDHAAPFDTDHCTACHDKSGGHADFIGNRVHAIHAANTAGDLNNYSGGVLSDSPSRVWDDITFPLGSISPEASSVSDYTCVKCHSSGNTSFQSNPYGSVCLGCHGDNDTNNGHMEQMGLQLP